MLNDNITISPIDMRTSQLNWTAANAEDVSWVFLGGKVAYGPIRSETAFRTAIIKLGSSDIKAVEVHDLPEEIIPKAIAVMPNTRPQLICNAVENAIKYKIYHRSGQSVQQRLVYDRMAFGGIKKYVINAPEELDGKGGKWHFFRCESVDRFGNQSLRNLWAYWVMDTPEAIKELQITDGAIPGTFNFTITT